MDKILEVIHSGGNRKEILSLIDLHESLSTKDLTTLVMAPGKHEDIHFFAMYLVENKGILPDENSLYVAALHRHIDLIDFFIEHKANLTKALEFCYFTRKDDAFTLLLARVSSILSHY